MESSAHIRTLIEKAQREEPAAFDALVEHCQGRARAIVARHVGAELEGKIEIDDLVQETFLEMWRSMRGFSWEGEKPFWAWLETIALRVIYVSVRRLKAKKRDGGEISLPHKEDESGRRLVELLKASAVTPSTVLQRDERFERLQRSMRRLKPDYRKVLFLARVRGLPIKEVARRMERSPQATSVLLVRALIKLKEAFGETESLNLPDRSLEAEGMRDDE